MHTIQPAHSVSSVYDEQVTKRHAGLRIRALHAATARLTSGSTACQCVMPMEFNGIECVTHRAAWQHSPWHWHRMATWTDCSDGELLRMHVRERYFPLRWSFEAIDTALECSQRAANECVCTASRKNGVCVVFTARTKSTTRREVRVVPYPLFFDACDRATTVDVCVRALVVL